MDPKAQVIPCLRYRQAEAAIVWLCQALGFEKQLVAYDDDLMLSHAQLTYGNGMIMIGSVRDTDFGRLMKQPDEIGGSETQTVYLVMADVDEVYEQVKSAKAEILFDLKEADYGGRGFTFRDLEGHIWSIGSYDPWG